MIVGGRRTAHRFYKPAAAGARAEAEATGGNNESSLVQNGTTSSDAFSDSKAD